jgi:hypothetical protein
MPRPIKILGKSYNKYGELYKVLLNVPVYQGATLYSIVNNLIVLAISDALNNQTRIIHYDIKSDKIVFDQTVNKFFWKNIYNKFNITDNLSFLDFYGNFYKYDPTTNSYSIIELNLRDVEDFYVFSDKLIVATPYGVGIYDLNGNQIKSFSIPSGWYYFYGDYVESENKIYFYGYKGNSVVVLDLTTLNYETINLPTNTSLPLGYCLRKMRNSNNLMYFNKNDLKLYQFDLGTNQATIIKDFSTYDFIAYGVETSYISEDGKIVFLVVNSIPNPNISEVWVYDVDKDKVDFVFPLIWYPVIFGDDKTRRYIAWDFYPTIIDLNKNKVETIFYNYPGWGLATNGKLSVVL